MEKRRVVVTSMGALTPVGIGAEESWQAIRAGRCGIGPITLYDASAMKASLVGEVKNFNPEDFMEKRDARKIDRFAQLSLAAAVECFRGSGLDMEQEDPWRCAVIFSSGIGGLGTLQNECVKAEGKGYDKITPFFIPMSIGNMAAGHIAIRTGFKGMCTDPTAACAGGTNAVGDAFHYIRDGYAEVAICGGGESTVVACGVGGFTTMHALSMATDPSRASIPFDAERSGFVMGEGAGALMLEELEHAKARGAQILAEVVGYGSTCDAYHITAPDPQGAGGARAMACALSDGGVAPEEVDYINAHGTATPMNDSIETMAVKATFGEHARKLMISSTKSMTGHLLGAAGAVEAIFTVQALRDGFVPATINFRNPDPECDLDIVPNEGRAVPIHCAMSNSLGFGGHNASIVLRRWEA